MPTKVTVDDLKDRMYYKAPDEVAIIKHKAVQFFLACPMLTAILHRAL